MSNKAGTLNNKDIGLISAQGGRVVREDNIVLNWADLMQTMYSGPSLINGKQQGTVFGVDMVIGQEKPAVSGKWDMGLLLDALVPSFVGTGYIQRTPGEETVELSTGTDVDGEAMVYSLKRVRYDPGTPLFMDYTVAFPKIEDANGDYTCGIGFSDGQDGFLHGSRRRNDEIEYGFILLRGGVETWYPMNGAEMPLDYNNLNIFRMDGGYLGVAPTNIHIQDIDQEIFVRLHRQKYIQRVTNVKTPDLSVGAFIRNEGNTNDIKILNGSFRAGTINGGQQDDPSAVLNTYERAYSEGAGINQTIFAFRNDLEVDMYNYLDISGVPTTELTKNTIASKLLQVKVAVLDNNKIVDIDLWIVPISDIISGTFTPVDLGRSVLKVSDDAVVDLTNAIRLETFLLGKDDRIPQPSIEQDDLLFPGFVGIFTLTTASANFDVNAYIKYADKY